jgi:2-hydroxychromene-2-carboxylate isomerase
MRQMEFWFSYGSTYTYLTVMRIEELAKRHGIGLVYRPFNLTIILREKGMTRGPFGDRPEKQEYMWRDLPRRARHHGVPYRRPVKFPVDTQRTVRVGFLAAREGWCPPFTRRVFEMNFLEGRPIDAPGTLEAAIEHAGKDPQAVIRRAHEPDIEQALAAETRKAAELGIFGSPNFVVEGELFWGDDRLEDAIEWCLSDAAVEQ